MAARSKPRATRTSSTTQKSSDTHTHKHMHTVTLTHAVYSDTRSDTHTHTLKHRMQEPALSRPEVLAIASCADRNLTLSKGVNPTSRDPQATWVESRGLPIVEPFLVRGTVATPEPTTQTCAMLAAPPRRNKPARGSPHQAGLIPVKASCRPDCNCRVP